MASHSSLLGWRSSSGCHVVITHRDYIQPVHLCCLCKAWPTTCHCLSSNSEVCAHFAKWIVKSNQPVNIINDKELPNLLTAGHPKLSLPSSATIMHDIKTSFEKCRDRIVKLCGYVIYLSHCLWLLMSHYLGKFQPSPFQYRCLDVVTVCFAYSIGLLCFRTVIRYKT